MKYIIFENTLNGEYPVVFPDFLSHRDIIIKIKDIPISAGSCELFEDRFYCKGYSESLKLKSRIEKDDIILNMLLKN